MDGAAAGQRQPGRIGGTCRLFGGPRSVLGGSRRSRGGGAGQDLRESTCSPAAARLRSQFIDGWLGDVAGVKDVHGMVGDAQQEALSAGVDDDDRGALADALAADNAQCGVSAAASRAFAETALQQPDQAKHRAQGYGYPQPKDQRVHSAKPLGDVEDPSDPDGVVLVQDDDLAVGDQPAVEQHVRGGAGGTVQFNDLARFQ